MGLGMVLCALVIPVTVLFGGTLRPVDTGSVMPMLISASVTSIAGVSLWWYGRSAAGVPMRRRESTLVVACIWIGAGLFGGLPYVLDAGFSPSNAFFESVSGFTTTGATVVTDIEDPTDGLSRPLLLWRSLTQWLGGMGIVVLFVAIFHHVGVGGKHLYRSEAPGPPGAGLRPRIAETSMLLWRIYGVLTLLLAILLWVQGLSPFEAICHAFTTLSTGGFSTRNASIGAFNHLGIELTVSLFMLLAGVNFGLYYGALKYRSLRVFFKSTELKVYCALAAATVLLMTASIFPQPHASLFTSLRSATFMVATTISSTGFGTDDYTTYGSFPLGLMLLLMIVGGSAGSTAGGIKIIRITLIFKLIWAQNRTAFRPAVVHVIRMSRSAVQNSVLAEVGAFFMVYMVCLGLGILGLTLLENISLPTAFGAMLTCLSNMGPAPFYESGADNFHHYSPISKYIFSLAMVLGRLEFFTLLALLLPDFWKR